LYPTTLSPSLSPAFCFSHQLRNFSKEEKEKNNNDNDNDRLRTFQGDEREHVFSGEKMEETKEKTRHQSTQRHNWNKKL